MKMIGMAAAVAMMLAPAAMAQTQSQQIVGRWTCMANTPDGVISGQMNYGKDGIARSTLIMAIAGSDGQVIMDITSTWRAPGDDTLREKVTNVDIVRFTMGGQVMGKDSFKDAIQDMMKDELQSGSLEVTATNLTMIDSDDVRTSCIR